MLGYTVSHCTSADDSPARADTLAGDQGVAWPCVGHMYDWGYWLPYRHVSRLPWQFFHTESLEGLDVDKSRQFHSRLKYRCMDVRQPSSSIANGKPPMYELKDRSSDSTVMTPEVGEGMVDCNRLLLRLR